MPITEADIEQLFTCETTHHIITLIVCMLLVYYFIRSNIIKLPLRCNTQQEYMNGMNQPSREHMNGDLFEESTLTIPLTDTNYKFGPLDKGIYGDVPVYFYEDADNAFAPQWRKIHGGVYVPNAKLYWRNTVIPKEVAFWKKDIHQKFRPK